MNPTLGQGLARIRQLEDDPDLALETENVDVMRRGLSGRIDHVARMRDAGVVMAAGSDSAWSYYQMGDFQTEIEAHAMTGMSNMQAIVSATKDSAQSCWVDATVGTLEVGKQADVLVVNGDPTRDLADLRNVADVFLAGSKIDRHNLV